MRASPARTATRSSCSARSRISAGGRSRGSCGILQDLGVERVVTFGSLLADVPHTRPSPVTAAASDESLMEELGLEPSRYEGPTGIVGVLLDTFRTEGVTSLSLWAAVPHYVSLAPSPRAALALVRRFGELMEIDVDVTDLEQAADEYSDQVSEAVHGRCGHRRRMSRSSSAASSMMNARRRIYPRATPSPKDRAHTLPP